MLFSRLNEEQRKGLPQMSDNDDVKEFSRRLVRAMADRFWNGAETARRDAAYMPDGKFGRDLITHYRRGHTRPRDLHVMALAKALEMTPEELFPEYIEGRFRRAAEKRAVTKPTKTGTPLVLTADGKIRLTLDKEVDLPTAVKILDILKDSQ